MASTWSSLKIQLMGAGDEGGTWGTVTNANLGTVIEEAITGSSNVTFASADVTLTLTDTTASQTARNLRLNLTGTTGGARNLIVPAIEKVYIVNNGCADAVTVKNSTGSGIAVPAGKTMYVYNTGSNVVDAVTHLTSLTLASPLPIASGGTGSTTATFSGENITNLNASNISSGTIANARTTASSSNGASTIVSRGASGEFSAGVITADGSGLTALNASNVSTGTLAVARGGTGAATLTANNVILGNGTSAVNFVAPGTLGNVLTSNGTTWVSQGIPAGGSVTTVSTAGTVNGLTLTGGPITTTGTVTLGGSINASTISVGTLAVGQGGTGITSAGSSGNVLASNGSAWASTALSALTVFGNSLGSNGYQRLPGGLIIQWGSADTGSGSSGSYTVTWPISFSSDCYVVLATISNTGSLRGIFVSAKTTTTGTFFTRNNTDPVSAPFFWVAIGS